jgi:hypothetical protein
MKILGEIYANLGRFRPKRIYGTDSFFTYNTDLLGLTALFVTKIMYLCGRKNFLMATMKKIILLFILAVTAMTADAQFLFS